MWWVAIALIFLVLVASWYATFITMWVLGNKKRSKPMVFVGAIFSLGIIGLIIAFVTTSNWHYMDTSSERILIERQRLELEKQRLELEKIKQNP